MLIPSLTREWVQGGVLEVPKDVYKVLRKHCAEYSRNVFDQHNVRLKLANSSKGRWQLVSSVAVG